MGIRGLAILVAAWFCVLPFGLALAQSAGPTTRPLTAAEEVELRNSVSQLTDRTRDAKTKAEAADMLLTRGYPQAVEAVKGILQDGTNTGAQIAIADGIARHGGKSDYVDALTAMLIGSEPTVRGPAGRALVTYKDQAVTKQLVDLALDNTQDKAVRLAVIATLQRVLDKEAVDALVKLLGDRDAAVRDGAMDALTKLTNIRAFNEPAQWKNWWEQNKNKDRNEWLADLAESLAKTKTALETDNVKLRDRLKQALIDMYAALPASPATQRDAFMISVLKDPLADVRQAGLALVQRRMEAATADGLPAEVRAQVRLLLADNEPHVREVAAMTLGGISDADTLPALLERLNLEDSATVQSAILTALGQLRDPKALPAVMPRLGSKYDIVCASAAKALGWIAAKQPLQDEQRGEAVKALIARYRQIENTAANDGLAVREALLGAMGVLQDKTFLAVLQAGLKDTNASIRLAAANAIVTLKDASAAEALLPLMTDTDRGVRLVAVQGLGALGGEKYLENVLQRIDPAVEAEPSVREAAWNGALAVFAQSSDKTLAGVCDGLKGRADATVQYIQVLQVLVGRLKEAKAADALTRQRELASALAKAQRPAEAATQLAEILKGSSPTADETASLWADYVDCLLAANDPGVCKVMVDQKNDKLFTAAGERMMAHLETQTTGENYAAVIAIIGEARKTLFTRLAETRRQALLDMLAACRTKQAQADQAMVAQQVTGLTSADDSVRTAAATKLTALGERALSPLIEELRKSITSAKADPEMEKALVSCIKQVAPRLNDYNVSAALADKLAKLTAWTKTASTQPE